MGQPRRQKPPLVTGISDGRVECEESHWLGTTRRDLDLLRWRPRGPSLSMMSSAAERPSGGPTRVPSSRYQAFKAREGTSALTLDDGL